MNTDVEKAYELEKDFKRISVKSISLIPSNDWVLLKQIHSTEQTKSGIVIPERVELPDRVPRMLEVVLAPEKLTYTEDYPAKSMLWETEIEIQQGDKVWAAYDSVADAFRFIDPDTKDKFYFVSYRDIFVAKRGDQIIPLNGNCIFEYIKKEKKSSLEVDVGQKDNRFGIVKFVGSKNKRYLDGVSSDLNVDIKPGDKVLFRNPESMNVKLESYLFPFFDDNKDKIMFNDRKDYRVAKRSQILGKL